MQKKKVSALILSILILLCTYYPASADSSGGISVMTNNKAVVLGSPAVSSGGTVLVPAKEFVESLGGTFTYNSDNMIGTAIAGGNELTFNLDDSVACFDGKYVQAPAPMKILNNRFMIPAAFAATELGASSFMNANRNMLMVFQPVNGAITYSVMPGDTLWSISQLFGTTLALLRQLNNLTSDTILVGQKLVVKNGIAAVTALPAYTTSGATIFSSPGFASPVTGYLGASVSLTVAGKAGDWYKVITPKGNGYLYYSVVGMKQELAFGPKSQFFNSNIPVDTSGDTVTYTDYTVAKGDYIWSLSLKFGIPNYELEAANNLTDSSNLMPGQVVRIPVHSIAAKSTPGPQYGEILDWFKEAQYVFPIGSVGTLTDIATGKSFKIERTMGASHSDTETLTAQDTQIMKDIFGGTWTWNRRPFLLDFNGRRLAVSVAGMPHAGVDGVPFLQNVDNRSGNYGYGPNYDSISGNGMDGHFDLYFLNSLTHVNNTLDPAHQYLVMKAGGLQ